MSFANAIVPFEGRVEYLSSPSMFFIKLNGGLQVFKFHADSVIFPSRHTLQRWFVELSSSFVMRYYIQVARRVIVQSRLTVLNLHTNVSLCLLGFKCCRSLSVPMF